MLYKYNRNLAQSATQAGLPDQLPSEHHPVRYRPGFRTSGREHRDPSPADGHAPDHGDHIHEDLQQDLIDPGFELEEDWIQAADQSQGSLSQHPAHLPRHTMGRQSDTVAVRPPQPIIVADLPAPLSAADSPGLYPNGLTFARRSSSTAGGAPSSLSRSDSLGGQSFALPGRMNRSVSIHTPSHEQQQRPWAWPADAPQIYPSAPTSAAPETAGKASIPIPYTGVGRKRSRTGPPAPFGAASVPSAAITMSAYTRQASISGLSSLGVGGSYGYGTLTALPMPPTHYPAAERSPMIHPNLFQSTPLPQGEFRSPPLYSTTPNSPTALRPPSIDRRSPSRYGNRPSEGSPPRRLYHHSGPLNASVAGQDPVNPPAGSNVDVQQLETAAMAMLGTSAPSNGRLNWITGSAPSMSRMHSANSRSPGRAAKYLSTGGSPFRSQRMTHDSSASQSSISESESVPPLHLPGPSQSLYCSGELNAVGEDENENEECEDEACECGGNGENVTVRMNQYSTRDAPSPSTSQHAGEVHQSRASSTDGSVSLDVPDLVGLGFKVGAVGSSSDASLKDIETDDDEEADQAKEEEEQSNRLMSTHPASLPLSNPIRLPHHHHFEAMHKSPIPGSVGALPESMKNGSIAVSITIDSHSPSPDQLLPQSCKGPRTLM